MRFITLMRSKCSYGIPIHRWLNRHLQSRRTIIAKTFLMITTITTTIIAMIILLVTCKAAGLSAITSAACLRALLALCSPSAAITCTGGEIIMMITWKPGEIIIGMIMNIVRV